MPTWYEVQVDRCDRATRRFRDGGSSSHRTVLERAGPGWLWGTELRSLNAQFGDSHYRPTLEAVQSLGTEDPFHHEREPVFRLEILGASRFSSPRCSWYPMQIPCSLPRHWCWNSGAGTHVSARTGHRTVRVFQPRKGLRMRQGRSGGRVFIHRFLH